MIKFLWEVENNCDVYSFGRVKEIKDAYVVVAHKKKSVKLYNVKSCIEPGSWVRFYGYKTDKKITVKFCEELKCIDIILFEKFVEKINHK